MYLHMSAFVFFQDMIEYKKSESILLVLFKQLTVEQTTVIRQFFHCHLIYWQAIHDTIDHAMLEPAQVVISTSAALFVTDIFLVLNLTSEPSSSENIIKKKIAINFFIINHTMYFTIMLGHALWNNVFIHWQLITSANILYFINDVSFK